MTPCRGPGWAEGARWGEGGSYIESKMNVEAYRGNPIPIASAFLPTMLFSNAISVI